MFLIRLSPFGLLLLLFWKRTNSHPEKCLKCSMSLLQEGLIPKDALVQHHSTSYPIFILRESSDKEKLAMASFFFFLSLHVTPHSVISPGTTTKQQTICSWLIKHVVCCTHWHTQAHQQSLSACVQALNCLQTGLLLILRQALRVTLKVPCYIYSWFFYI